MFQTHYLQIEKWASYKKMTTELFSISIAIIVLAQQILHLAKEESFVEELVRNCERINPK